MSLIDLRPVVQSDAEELITANRASLALHHPWVQPFTDADGFASWFADMTGDHAAGLVARERATGRIVGVFNITQIFRKGFQSAYLGFYGMEGGCGRGLMTEALRLTLAHAFGPLALHRIEANIQPGNARSIALVERVGFRREGFSPRYLRIDGDWRDHERWAFLADEMSV